jgi:hypothetical protein
MNNFKPYYEAADELRIAVHEAADRWDDGFAM